MIDFIIGNMVLCKVLITQNIDKIQESFVVGKITKIIEQKKFEEKGDQFLEKKNYILIVEGENINRFSIDSSACRKYDVKTKEQYEVYLKEKQTYKKNKSKVRTEYEEVVEYIPVTEEDLNKINIADLKNKEDSKKEEKEKEEINSNDQNEINYEVEKNKNIDENKKIVPVLNPEPIKKVSADDFLKQNKKEKKVEKTEDTVEKKSNSEENEKSFLRKTLDLIMGEEI